MRWLLWFGAVCSLVLLILFMQSASAAVTVVKPVTSGNYTTSAFFNVSYVNVTDSITTPRNVTFYYNLSGTWTKIGSSGAAACIIYNNACNVTLSIASLTDGIYSINATLDNGTDQIGASVITTLVRFDSTKPIVYISNVTSATAVGNYSGALVLNVSVADAGMGVATVFFNITNSSAMQNASYAATNEAGTSRYSVSISTSHFPDGTYNITVYANDTQLGNLNNSAVVQDIRFDNTAPAATLTCTPNPVTAGDTLTCSCAGSDATAGVNRTSYTINPSTALTGSFTTSCDVRDFAGNSVSTTFTYTVDQNPGTSSSSGGGGSSSSSAETTNRVSRIFSQIAPGTPAVMTNIDGVYGVKEIQINVAEATSNVKVIINKYDSRPSAVSSDKSGKVYKYLQITAEGIGDKMRDGKVRIQVQKSWLGSNGLSKNDVAMFKFVSGQWTELSTTFVSEDAENDYYDVSLNSFSYFAIGDKPATAAETSAETTTTAAEENVQASPPQAKTEESRSWAGTAMIILIVLLLAGAVVFWFYRRKYR